MINTYILLKKIYFDKLVEYSDNNTASQQPLVIKGQSCDLYSCSVLTSVCGPHWITVHVYTHV